MIQIGVDCMNAANILLVRLLDSQEFANRCHIGCKISTFSWQYWLHQFEHYVMLFFNSSLSYSVSYTSKGILQPISDYSNPLSSSDPAWPQSCVEYAEKAALQRHSMWSGMMVDVFLGNVLSTVLLWFHAEQFTSGFQAVLMINESRAVHWLCVANGKPSGFQIEH
ncbi:hypothetical protein LIER_17497 [Lithospermum erythrorhizon]|uniref:Uncharacterized protein n=1 Tax=Lithospermum erythrorhizon TaxID=34254 RepID=A0AAV3QC56_LITER